MAAQRVDLLSVCHAEAQLPLDKWKQQQQAKEAARPAPCL